MTPAHAETVAFLEWLGPSECRRILALYEQMRGAPFVATEEPEPVKSEFETEREGFNTYILHDGTRLKFKAVVGQIVRLEAYNPNGEPLYLVNATNVLVADVPDNLKRKA